MTESKSMEDMVRLVNISGEGSFTNEKGEEIAYQHKPVVFDYDGQPFEIDNFIIVKRLIAEHAMKRCVSVAEGRRWVKTEELPIDQRSLENLAKVGEKNEELEKENAKLRAQLSVVEPDSAPTPKRGRPAGKKTANG